MSGIVEYITGRTDVFYNEKNQIKEGKTAEDILKDITDTETLQKISDAILIDKNFLLLEEYNELARNDRKKIQQLYRLGHLSKAKSLHTECDMDDLSKAMEAFNLGKKRISGGNSSGDDESGDDESGDDEKPEAEKPEAEKPEAEKPEAEPEEPGAEKPEAESQHEEEPAPEASSSDDVEKTFKEIGSKSVEITKLLSTQSAIGDFKNELSTNMQGLKELTDNIKGKSMECLQSLAMSLFGLELQNAADKVASVTGTMALGAAIASIPSYPNEVGDIILTVFKYSTLSVKYFIKLYITYIIGALAKSGLESGVEDFKVFIDNTTKKLLQIATAASVDIEEVQKMFKEYIPTVITNEITKQNRKEFMKAVQKGLQQSVDERNNKINNVKFQSQKSFPEIPDNEQEKMITDTPKIGELSEGRLVEMIETEDLDEDIKKGLEDKLEKMTGKRKRGDESDDDAVDKYKKPKVGGKKQHTRKQKKQTKKQKKQSKNKSKKQKKNRTKKTRGKKH